MTAGMTVGMTVVLAAGTVLLCEGAGTLSAAGL